MKAYRFAFAFALGLSTVPATRAADPPVADAPAAEAPVAGQAVRSEAEFLAELKRLAKPQDFDGEDFRNYVKSVSDRAEKVLDLLERLTAAHPKSAQLAEARFKALAPVTRAFELEPSRWSKRARDLAEAVAAEADAADGGKPRVKRKAVADLVLLQLDCDEAFGSLLVVHNMSEAERTATWNKSGPAVVARIEAYLKKYPQHAPAAEYPAELDRSFRLFGKPGDVARREIMRIVGEAQPESEQGRLLKLSTLVGKPLDFSFEPVGSDKTLSLKDLRGKVVVLDFWATWCPPCVAGLDELKKIHERRHERGVEIIGINQDEELAPLQEMMAGKKLPWPQAFGKKVRKSSDKWGVFELPTLFVLDKKGVVRSVEHRDDLETLISELPAE